MIIYNNYRIDKEGNVFAIKLNKFLSPYSNGLGYMAVKLRINGVRKQFYVHRLVANSFIENPSMLSDVNHKDGNKNNNSIDNLEWVTRKENMKHAFRNGLLGGFVIH